MEVKKSAALLTTRAWGRRKSNEDAEKTRRDYNVEKPNNFREVQDLEVGEGV